MKIKEIRPSKLDDTATISMFAIDTLTRTIVLEYPQNAVQGVANLYIIPEDIAPGNTHDITIQLTSEI